MKKNPPRRKNRGEEWISHVTLLSGKMPPRNPIRRRSHLYNSCQNTCAVLLQNHFSLTMLVDVGVFFLGEGKVVEVVAVFEDAAVGNDVPLPRPMDNCAGNSEREIDRGGPFPSCPEEEGASAPGVRGGREVGFGGRAGAAEKPSSSATHGGRTCGGLAAGVLLTDKCGISL